MAIFAIISQDNPNSGKLPGAITTIYKDDCLEVGPGEWLIADTSTCVEVSNKLGITDGSNGAAIILEVANYYGRANTNIWAWIKTKWEAKNG